MIYIDIYSTRAVIRSQEPLTVGLAGGQAHFRFSDRWKNLTKTVVFRQGDITKDVVGVTSGAVIPHEVLKIPGEPVEIGVYGSDGKGKIIIPTVWVATDPVLEGADPMVDVSTAPTLPVYQQIQVQVEVNRAQIEKNTPFTVKIFRNDAGGYEANTSLNDILSVWHSGRPLVAMYENLILPLTQINGIGADFTSVMGSTTNSIRIEKSTVSVQAWKLADDATVEALGKTVADHTDRLVKLEAGGVGGGGAGVYIGTEPPENPNVEVWINPEAGTSFQDAASYDESIEVSEVKDHVLLNLPCPVSDFEILQIHLTTKQAQFKLNMDVGGKSTFLANTQGGQSSGVHVLLMPTHNPEMMNMDVQTASYTENAQPSVPDRLVEVNKDAASIMLYTEDAGGGFQPGTTIHAWGVYKASGSAVLQMKDPETGEWKAIKTIQGEHGRDGSDYILTDADRREIAEQAAGLVDVPEYKLPMANPDTLGGVRPVDKTEAMTNPVGVDELGGLWSAGGSDHWEQIFSLTAEENIHAVTIPLVGSDYKYIWLKGSMQAWDVAAGNIYTGANMIPWCSIGSGQIRIPNISYGAAGKYTSFVALFFNVGSDRFVPLVVNPNANGSGAGSFIAYNPMDVGAFTIADRIHIAAHHTNNTYLFATGSTFELLGVRK